MTSDAIERTAVASDQQRDWWHREHENPNPDLVTSFRVGVAADVPPDRLRLAVEQLVRRHGALRTSFAAPAGEVVQQVHRDGPGDAFWVEDLRGLDEESTAERYAALVARERDQEFDLARTPLFRVGLVRLAGPRSVVAFSLHHVIADGWATGRILEELSALLSAAVDSTPADLPPALQCTEWAQAERSWSEGPAAATQLAYWQRTLAGVSPFTVPPSRPGGAPGFRHAQVTLTGDADLAARVAAAARAARTFPVTVALAAYLGQLSAVAGRDDVATNVMVTGRAVPGYDTVVGSLTNVVAVAAAGVAGSGLAELLPRVRTTLLQAYAHQRLFVTRVWAGTSLGPGDVDSLFIFDQEIAGPERFGPYPTGPTPPEAPRTFTRQGGGWENLKLRHTSGAAGFTVTIEYDANRYDAELAGAIGTGYLRALGTL